MVVDNTEGGVDGREEEEVGGEDVGAVRSLFALYHTRTGIVCCCFFFCVCVCVCVCGWFTSPPNALPSSLLPHPHHFVFVLFAAIFMTVVAVC